MPAAKGSSFWIGPDPVEITLSLDTDAYQDGDVLFDTQKLANVCRDRRPAVLCSLQLLDEDAQGIAIDLKFLRSNQSIGTENAAFAPSDAVAREILTEVPIAAADYDDLTNSKQVTRQVGDTGMGMIMQPTTGDDLYVAGVARGAGTFTASGVRLRVGFIGLG